MAATQQQQQHKEGENQINEDEKEPKNDNRLPPEAYGEEECFCYICWDVGTEEAPLVRDCGCKGSAGLVHLACLIEAAETKAKQGNLGTGLHNVFDPFLRPWAKCHQCCQPYRDPTKTALMNAMVVNSTRRWERILASVATLGLALAVYSLYCVLESCFEWFLVHLILEQHQQFTLHLVQAWTTIGHEFQTILVVTALCGLAKLMCDNWEVVRRNLRLLITRAVTFLSTMILFSGLLDTVLCDYQQGGSSSITFFQYCSYKYGYLDWIAIGVSLGVLALQAYHHRRNIRNKIIQIRREGLLAALLGIAMTILLVALRVGIDHFVYTMIIIRT